MAIKAANTHPLQHEGTTQEGRIIDALQPENVKIHNLQVEDWLDFTREYAKHILFYGESDPNQPNGNWEPFFAKYSTRELLQKVQDKGGDTDPYMALFIAFLRLLEERSGPHLNTLPKRHLDFYYQDVLRLKKLPFQPDQLHAIFKLAQNAKEQLVPQGTRIIAGKDPNGNKRFYKTTSDLVVNQAEIAQLRSIYFNNDPEEKQLLAAYDAKKEGIQKGKEGNDNDNPKTWSAFGHDGLEEATFGFAVASDILQLQEGERTITFTFFGKEAKSNIKEGDINKIELTGKDGWIKIKPDSTSDKKEIKVTLAKEESPVVPFNPQTHSGNYNTQKPIARFLFSNQNFERESLKRLKAEVVKSVKINVDVDEVRGLQLSNDYGPLDPSKTFYPFGGQPFKGANFYINHQEVKAKKLNEVNLELTWENFPEDFESRYQHYTTIDWFSKYQLYNINDSFNANPENILPVSYPPIFKAISKLKSPSLLNCYELNLFSEIESYDLYNFKIVRNSKKTINYYSNTDIFEDDYHYEGSNLITISTQTDFGHVEYPRIYAEKMIEKANSDKPDTVELPKEPYTPQISDIFLSYVAEENQSFSTDSNENDSENTTIQFFHIEPFGVKEQRTDLKKDNGSGSDNGIPLLPLDNLITTAKNKHGKYQFLIGLKNLEPLQNLSLLFQVEEGSETAGDVPQNLDQHPIKWSVLEEGNVWQKLDDQHKVSDTTNRLLQSGIMNFQIPEAATKESTLLDPGLIWLKAEMNTAPGSVCKLVDVHTNAVEAEFVNQENDLSHLETALPAGTATKIQNRPARIKEVQQPYSSFNGRPREKDSAYYTRVSERLRHKQRAVNLWDFEHLILQQFPEIRKVKCLTHTKYTEKNGLNFRKAGHITIIVVPDLRNVNAANSRKPKVSANKLKEIKQFLINHNKLSSGLISNQVKQVQVINPLFTGIRIKANVAFHDKKGVGDYYYMRKLKNDFKTYLAPWIENPEKEVHFGGQLHRNQVVYFMETLSYIKYVTDVKLKAIEYEEDENKFKKLIQADNEAKILVPASKDQHDLTILEE